MCRMFFISSKKIIPTQKLLDYLIESEKSLVKQSQFNKNRLQKDGWGFGYIKGEKIEIFKSINPIYQELNLIKNKIQKIENNFFIVHARKASNPKKIEFNKLISYENTQPFSISDIIFTHNGTLNIVDEIYENLGKYKKFVKGINDSEVLFWHVIKNIDAYGDIKQAILAARREIHTVWISVKKEYRQFDEPYTGLNIFLTNSEKFYALCDFKLKKETFSIMTENWEYGNYALRFNKDEFTISSEPLDKGKWEKVPHNSIIEFDIKKFKYNIKNAGELL
ncbi:MAG: class II glutamine amidotransferase [Candidatus Goldbacteria bacterium]|nr:class II glutamine amidotransferase [Candidatus Goldiibacteriota bacterium]